MTPKQLRSILPHILGLIGLFVLGILSAMFSSENEDLPSEDIIGSNTSTNSEIDENELYDVLEIVDGDTIKVSEIGTLRLIGIDTPETKDPRKEVECFGQEASDHARKLLEGVRVRLKADPTQDEVDRYGRKLVYVFREDGLFFNEVMIAEGYAHEYTYSTPYKYQAQFKQAEDQARTAELGLWGDACKCEKGREVTRECTGCNEVTIEFSNWDCSTYKVVEQDELCGLMCE